MVFVRREHGYYTREEVAAALRVDPSTLSRWGSTGGGPWWLDEATEYLTPSTLRYRASVVNREITTPPITITG